MNVLFNDEILIIVKSLREVKTISDIFKYLGYKKFKVIASTGPIMKLKDGGTAFNSGIYPEQDFKMNLAVIEDKKKIIANITEQAKTADKIFMLTDNDPQDFLIGWSIIKFCDLPSDKCYRIILRELTSEAVMVAIANPVPFNDNIIKAGLTRLMTDKLIGYSLSPLVKKYLGAKSIGRCQAIGLKVVSDREKEIEDFIPELSFSLYLHFVKNNKHFKAKYIGYSEQEKVDKFTKQADINAIMHNCKNTPYKIKSIKKIVNKELPNPPFCTATFLQEAINKLGISAKEAITCAKKLFEGIKLNGVQKGLITYIYTDSTEILTEFLPKLECFIKSTYGNNKYIKPKVRNKKNTIESYHEAIRIVDPEITPEILATQVKDNLLLEVYTLIWQRTLMSVMPAAEFLETQYTIVNAEHRFTFNTNELLKAGYMEVYDLKDCQIVDNLDDFIIEEELKNTNLEIIKEFTEPITRFTEASLIENLQQMNISKPNSYVTIIESILDSTRDYAKLEKNKIVLTNRGLQVADYCNRALYPIINLKYFKNLEESLDKIANGMIFWLDYIKSFYKNILDTINNIQEIGIIPTLPDKICPNCGNPMIIRRSRFGKLFYGCSTYPACSGILDLD